MLKELDMEMGERIKSAREKKGLSGKELAAMADISNVTLSRIEKGRYKPSRLTIEKIASPLEVTADHLLGRANISATITGSSSMVADVTSVALPHRPILLGQGITWSVDLVELPAGAGKVAFEETEVIGNMLLKFPEQVDFAMRVRGDSMEPEIKDGALLFVRSFDNGQEIRRGDLIICSVLDAPGIPDWMVRRANVHRKKNFSEIILEANNGRAEVHPYDVEHIYCLGRVIDWINDEPKIREILNEAKGN